MVPRMEHVKNIWNTNTLVSQAKINPSLPSGPRFTFWWHILWLKENNLLLCSCCHNSCTSRRFSSCELQFNFFLKSVLFLNALVHVCHDKHNLPPSPQTATSLSLCLTLRYKCKQKHSPSSRKWRHWRSALLDEILAFLLPDLHRLLHHWWISSLEGSFCWSQNTYI